MFRQKYEKYNCLLLCYICAIFLKCGNMCLSPKSTQASLKIHNKTTTLSAAVLVLKCKDVRKT